MVRKIYHLLIVVINFTIFPVYFVVKRDPKAKHDFLEFCNRLRCPFEGYRAFFWLFLNFQEYRSIVYHRKKLIKAFYSFVYRPQIALHIDTPSEKLGEGLMIWHGYSTILNAEYIGKNCTIWHQVTIGNKLDDGEFKPIIKNNVKICTGAIIIGRITIGNNAVIGAGSVVVKDVPDNAVVAGVPAKVIKYQTKE